MLDLGSSLIASVNRDPSSIALTYNNKNPLFSPGLIAGNPIAVDKTLDLLNS